MAKTEQADRTTTDLVKSYFEAVANRDVEAMIGHWDPDGRGYIHGIVDIRVPDTYRGWFADMFEAFPDWKFEVLDMVAEGEMAVVRWRATATFTGPVSFEGLNPNGERIDIEGCDVVTIRDGKIVSIYAYTNGAEMMRQLGALPAQGSMQEKALLGALNARTGLSKRLRRR